MTLLLVVVSVLSSALTLGQECAYERARADNAFSRIINDRDWSAAAMDELALASQLERLCLGDPTPRSADLLSRELWALDRRGRRDEALVLAEELIPIVEPVSTPATITYLYTRLGAMYFLTSRYADAARAYTEAVRRAPPPERANAYIHLATLYRRTHRYHAALAAADSAKSYTGVAIDPSYSTPRSWLLELDVVDVSVTNGVAIPAERIDYVLNRGQAILDHSIEMRDEISYVEAISSLSRLHVVRGDTSAAENILVRLNRQYTSEQAKYNSFRVRAAHALSRNDLEQAFEFYSRAAEGLHEITGNNRVAVMTTLGDLYTVRDEAAQSIDAYLRAENYAFEEAAQGVASDLTASLFRNVKRAGRGSARAYLQLGRAEDALLTIDRVSARYLSALRGTLRESNVDRVREIEDELVEIRAMMRRLEGKELLEARARESALVAELDRAVDRPHTPHTLRLADLQARLTRKNQAMLVYVMDDARFSHARLYRPHVIVVTGSSVQSIELDTTPARLAQFMLDVSPIFESGGAGIREQAFELPALARLYDVLIRPAESLLPAGAGLVIVPDGPLHHLPFGMLVRSFGDRFDYRSARYLIHDHPVSVELSPSLYVEPGGDPTRRDLVTGLARTAFNGERYAEPAVNLPAAAREVGTLRRRFANVRTYRNNTATPTVLLESLRTSTAVHVATHAVLDPLSHLNHSILLSPDDRRDDGTLYVFDLVRRDFGTPFVALTGCATASGPIHGGEGMAGFQYAFRAANVASVLSTNWLVDDDIMAWITDVFYEGLGAGLTKDEALRRAQLAYLETAPDERTSPFYWAAPVIYGDTTPLQFTPAQPRARNLALAAAVILALAALLTWRRGLFSTRRTISPSHA